MSALPLSLLMSAALAAWVGLAFVPALVEAARRRMAMPLPVAQLSPNRNGCAWRRAFQNASVVWPDSVR
ncbi:MAG: hypothetical protein AAF170_15050, partial [Bacteroidota bacterium]